MIQMVANKICAENIPAELKKSPSWVCWRREPRGEKVAKPPINPRTSRPINANDPTNWLTFEQAETLCESSNVDGVGFVFNAQDEFVGVDIDHCIDSSGRLNDLAQQLVSKLNSYTEVSVSGTGLHIICRGNLPHGKNRDEKLGLEMYDAKRYFAMTGQVWGDYRQIRERTRELHEVHAKYLERDETPRRTRPGNMQVSDVVNRMKQGREGQRLSDLWEGRWSDYYSSQNQADLALVNALAFYTNRDTGLIDEAFRTSGLYRPKWDERHSESGTYGQSTIAKAVASTNPAVSSSISERTHDAPSQVQLPPWYSATKNGRAEFMPGILAAHLAQTVPAVYAHSQFYLYESGVYAACKPEKVKSLIQSKLLDRYVRATHVKDVLELWQNRICIDGAQLDSKEIRHIINFQNGLYDVYRKQCGPHSSTHLSTIQLQAKYFPDARCPQFESFLRDVVAEENIAVLQEIMGLVMVPFTEAQKAFVFYGPPRTGKSTIMRIIEDILGHDNATHVSLQELRERFKTAELAGKLCNLCADLPNRPIEDAGVFKLLTGEDTVLVDKKYAQPFSFVNRARMVFSCNELPRNTGDRTDGFYRRLIIVPFEHSVDEEHVDVQLTETLLKEKEGIVQWALKGLERLMENGFRFSESASSKRIVEGYRAESDNVVWFVEQHCSVDHELEISSTVLYQAYKKACVNAGLRPASQIGFTRSLERLLKEGLAHKKDPVTHRALLVGISLSSAS